MGQFSGHRANGHVQPTLHQGIVDFFDDHFDDDFARTQARRHRSTDKGHGREAFRMYVICPVPEDLPDRERWADLKAIEVAMNIVYRDGKECCESRYYILSRKLTAKRFAEAVRAHLVMSIRKGTTSRVEKEATRLPKKAP